MYMHGHVTLTFFMEEDKGLRTAARRAEKKNGGAAVVRLCLYLYQDMAVCYGHMRSLGVLMRWNMRYAPRNAESWWWNERRFRERVVASIAA